MKTPSTKTPRRRERARSGAGEAPPAPERVPATLPWATGAGLAAFALYVALAPGTVGDGDAGEFTLMLAVGGVPHPPGYPLYAMGGHAWVALLHALGVGWARAASAWSAFGGAVAVALFVALGMRLAAGRADAAGRAAAALAAGALFALHPVWLREAMVAEVNTWHLALTAALCLAAFVMREGLARGVAPERIARGALLWGLLCGAALSHRITQAFFVLPLTVLLAAALPRGERTRPAVLFGFLAGLVVPYLAYGFVAWRASQPAAAQWPLLEPGLAGLFAHMRGEVFTFYLGGFAPTPDQRALLQGTVYPLLVPGLLLLVWTMFRARERTARAFAGALFAAAAIQTAFALQYGVPDPLVYFLPAVMAGLLALAERLSVVAARLPGPGVLAPAAAAAGMIALLWLPQAWSLRGHLASVDRAIRAKWESIPFERGVVMWTGDYYVRLRAYQILDGEKRGLYVESPAMLTWAPPRRAFQRAVGVDPLAGLTLETDADLPRIGPNVARQTGLPVIDFERWRP